MAKFVIAGAANCPYFARAELLADNLQTNLPGFRIHKIIKDPGEWENWLSDTCQQNGWAHTTSPLIWRELINRGGKGVLIGGSNEFQEYAAGYYGISTDMVSSDMTAIGAENMETHKSVTEEAQYTRSLSKPLRVCFTNASSPVAYHMLQEIASGDVIGSDIELSFHLLVQEDEMDATRGTCLEVVDMAHPLLRDVKVTFRAEEAMEGAGLIIILDEIPKVESESRQDWIKQCGEMYTNYGSIINKYASSDCKVVMAGKGALNLGAYLISKEARNISRQNIVVSSRLPENRAKSALARRINVNSSGVVNAIVWGNCGGKTHVDLTKCNVHGCEGAIWGPPSYSRPIQDMVHDDKWLQTEYLQSLEAYEVYIKGSLGHTPSFSEAHSLVATIRDWWNGTTENQIYSMGVMSDGSFGIPEGLFFSVPVKFSKGGWNVRKDIDNNTDLKEKLSQIVEELKQEIHIICSTSEEASGPEKIVTADKVFGGDNSATVISTDDNGLSKIAEEVNETPSID